ncbi:fibronectin type III domain-containing protein [Sulfurimonas sp.]|nr:fibronectin type III domain-containing protein [Sulfurimonas sp.]
MKINQLIIKLILLFTFVTSGLAGVYNVSNGTYQDVSFSKDANKKYTVELTAISGDCDLYGHHAGIPRRPSYYHLASENYGVVDESFSFESTSASTYYISIYADGDCSGNLTISQSSIVTIPSSPTRISPSGTITDTTPLIEWSAPNGATSYQLSLHNATDNNWVYNETPFTTNSKTSTTLIPGKTYTWWVQACNSAGCSPEGSTFNTFTVASQIPSSPTRISPSGTITDTTPLIEWSAPNGATSYQLSLHNATDNNWVYNETPFTTNSKTSTTLIPGKTYTWWVQACNSAGCSPEGSTFNTFDIPNEDTPIEIFRQEFITYDPKVATILTDVNLNDKVSRAEAAIMVEKFLSYKSLAFKNYDMTDYYLAFADVDTSSDYYPSLLKLSYYQGDEDASTPISKENSLFRPLDKVSRQEFAAILVRGLDLEIDNSNSYISNFSDFNNGTIADWAYPYLNTAVKNGLMSGNNGEILAQDKLSVYEAMVMLSNAEIFDGNYRHGEANFQTPDSLDISKLLHKQIGYEYMPRYYENSATPIDMTSVSESTASAAYCGKDDAIVLTVNAITDGNFASKVSEYYWWSTNTGYFREYTGSSNFKKVCFFPATAQPVDGYKIVVNGGDNLGFVDSITFTGLNASTIHSSDADIDKVSVTNDLSFTGSSSSMVANSSFSVNINGSFSKAGTNIGIENITVTLIDGVNKYTVFKGQSVSAKATFIVPQIDSLYGKIVKLEVIAQTQNAEVTQEITNLKYLPVFSVRGKVYNTDPAYKADYVTIGNTNVNLDENNEFYHTVASSIAVDNLNLQVHSLSQRNSFDSLSIDLTFENPQAYVTFVGTDELLDSDGDGVIDTQDDFPYDATETTDSDYDGVGDNTDAFPDNSNETVDTDSDGYGDNSDAFPSNPNEWSDSNGNGVGDNSENIVPSISGVSPTTAEAGTMTTFTVAGTNLPSTIVLSLSGSGCSDAYEITPSSAKLMCNIGSVLGNSNFNALTHFNGSALSGSPLSVSVIASAASVNSISPLSVEVDSTTTFTVNGSNLPESIALSLHGSLSCTPPFDVTDTSAKTTCEVGSTLGSKDFDVKLQFNGGMISGAPLNVDVVAAVDNQPIVTINTLGSDQVNNPKTSNFSLDVSANDDNGLQTLTYTILGLDDVPTGQAGNANIVGTSANEVFFINVDALVVGSYKIKVEASDTKPQSSDPQWYYFQKADSTGAINLNSLIVGNTLYENNCANIDAITFRNDGVVAFVYADGSTDATSTYYTAGHILYVTKVGEAEEELTAVAQTSEYIEFSTGGGTFKMYFAHAVAEQNPDNSECGNNSRVSYTIDDGIANTKIIFRDGAGAIGPVPEDAWIRIVPKSFADINDYNHNIVCDIQADGSFENTCFVYSETQGGLDTALANPVETYQVVVFKNHLNVDQNNWDCGEDLYKYVGNSESNWSNIEVLTTDYQVGDPSQCSNTPTVGGVSPVTANADTNTTFTVTGTDLPSTIALSLHGSLSCSVPFNVTATSAQTTCEVGSALGSRNFYVAPQPSGDPISGSPLSVNVVAGSSDPVVTSVSPTTVEAGSHTVFTITGNNLPSTLETSMQEGDCGTAFNVTPTSAKVSCLIRGWANGTKLLFVTTEGAAEVINGAPVSVEAVNLVDDKPFVRIHTNDSDEVNNPKSSNFNLHVFAEDDFGVQGIAYVVLNMDLSSTGLSGVENFSAQYGEKHFNINVDALAVGSYKIQVQASDTKPQGSDSQWYYFQKTGAVDSDGDGYNDNVDAFPNDPNEWEDANNNGIGNNSESEVDTNSTISHNGKSYDTVTSPTTGKVWLDRNLGADRVCTSSTDSTCYGDYYQFGRMTDGHEKSTSATSTTLASSITNAGPNFIVNNNSPYDWTTVDASGSLRSENWKKTDGTSVCPVGFRVPSLQELTDEYGAATDSRIIGNVVEAYNSFLKLPAAGQRRRDNGQMESVSQNTYIWANDVSSGFGANAYFYGADSGGAAGNGLTNSYSVRCIQDSSYVPVDSDGDGTPDATDAFPNDPSETADSDNDGYGDNSDVFPNDPNEWEDLNNNGIGDNADNTVTFNIDLNEGWNLISLPAIATVSIAGLNNPDIEVVRSFQNEQWYTWTSNDLSTSDQALANLQNGYGYWIKATNNTVFSVSGAPVTGSIDIATDGKWHMAGSAQIDSLSTFFDNHRTVVTIWKYVAGEWLSISRDIDIQETMNDANITRLNNVNNIEGFMYKGVTYDQGPLLIP